MGRLNEDFAYRVSMNYGDILPDTDVSHQWQCCEHCRQHTLIIEHCKWEIINLKR